MSALELELCEKRQAIRSESGRPVSSIDVLIPLSILAANLFMQRRAILADILSIEPKTYRILRLLPSVAGVDAAGCLLALIQSWPEIRQRTVNARALNVVETSQEKCKVAVDAPGAGAPSFVRTRLGSLSKFLKTSASAIIALVSLFKLTACRGIPWVAVCGWTLFMSYTLNEIALRYMSEVAAQEEMGPPSVAEKPTTRGQPEVSDTLKEKLQFLMRAALQVELLHMAWLGQYHVPRRLWMDWGPPQRGWHDHSKLTFSVPPDMPPVMMLSGQVPKGLVVGFWPSHTISGMIFFPISCIVCVYLTTLYTNLLLLAPCVLILIAWCFMLFLTCNLVGGMIFGVAESNSIDRLRTWVATNIEIYLNRLASLPRWSRFGTMAVVGIPVLIIGLAVGVLLFLLVSAPLILIGRRYAYRNEQKILFLFLDRPEGSYTSMTGVLMALSLFIFWRWGVPTITRKEPDQVTENERRYWTSVIATTMMSILSISHCLFHLNVDETYKPGWLWFIP